MIEGAEEPPGLVDSSLKILSEMGVSGVSATACETAFVERQHRLKFNAMVPVELWHCQFDRGDADPAVLVMVYWTTDDQWELEDFNLG